MKCKFCDGTGHSCKVEKCTSCDACWKCNGSGILEEKKETFPVIKRWLYSVLLLGNDYGAKNKGMERTLDEDEAVLISSEVRTVDGEEVDEELFAPVIDLDFPCKLVPSSTKNHYHLFINKALTKKQFIDLLSGLHSAGLIDTGFVNQYDDSETTFVRIRDKKYDPKPK